MDENKEESVKTRDESQNASGSDPNLTSKECNADVIPSVVLSLQSTSPENSQDQPITASSVGESIMPISPTQEQSTGAVNETIFQSVSAATVPWSVVDSLCKESDQLLEKILGFVSKLYYIKESRDTSHLVPIATDNDQDKDEAAVKAKESAEMLNAVIKEAVQAFQNFHSCFKEMDEKMKQWVPDAAKTKEGEKLLISKHQADKIEQELRAQLDEKKAEYEQMQIKYEEQLKKKDDDVAKLQESLAWKNDAEEYKKQIEKYKQEVEEQKQKIENFEKTIETLEKENKDHKNKEEQDKDKIQQLQVLIKTKGDEVAEQEKQRNAIIAEVKKLEEDAKQREDEIQKMQHEIDKKKEETEKQMEHSAENKKLQTEMKTLQDESMYWKGKCEGLHENQENLNKCVNAISEMGKLALKKMPDAAETKAFPNSST